MTCDTREKNEQTEVEETSPSDMQQPVNEVNSDLGMRMISEDILMAQEGSEPTPIPENVVQFPYPEIYQKSKFS